MHRLLPAILGALLIAAMAWGAESVDSFDDAELARQVQRLVRQLDDDRAAQRDEAERQLFDLAGATAAESDRLLALLPEPTDDMPLAVRDRLARIRREIEEGVARAAVEGSRVTLSAENLPLADVLATIERQTGNRLVDRRGQIREAPPDIEESVSVDFQDEPFWSAVDQVLDQVGRDTYSYAGDDTLAIVPAGPNDAPRHGRASYVGPFRVEVLDVHAQRNLRKPERQSLRLGLEVAWEPRLRPIAISQPAADLSAMTDAGESLPVMQPQATFGLEVARGTQAAEIVLPFELPARDVRRITSLRGKLRALVPGRRAEFRFADLPNAAGQTERRGGVQVTIDAVRQAGPIWEIHMRLRLDDDNRSLESHRGWVFQNVSQLVSDDGRPIDHAGFETTRQTPNEVGIAYLFDLPDGTTLDGLTWIYETPAAIVELPIEYELTDIELP